MSNHSRREIYRPIFQSSWGIQQRLGQPPAKVSVRNLQAIFRVGKDAWGREGKVQPVLISATVSLRQPFGTASIQDEVNKSTIHYGLLSKAILEATQEFSTADIKLSTLTDLILHIKQKLTLSVGEGSDALLDRSLVSSLELELTLPKALLSSRTGVTRSSIFWFNELSERQEDELDYWGMGLELRNLQVSTLIGVNSNERLAKQLLIVTIEIDFWIARKDVYNELEEVAVKTIEESSFQTLESLAYHLAWRIARYFIHPHFVEYYKVGATENKSSMFPIIQISLSKPTAVTLADAPIVEICVDSRPLLARAPPCTQGIPFPLQARVDEWIREHDPEGLEKDPVLGR